MCDDIFIAFVILQLLLWLIALYFCVRLLLRLSGRL